MDDVLLVDVGQGRADGGRLAAQAVVPLHVTPVAGEAGKAAATQQVIPAEKVPFIKGSKFGYSVASRQTQTLIETWEGTHNLNDKPCA